MEFPSGAGVELVEVCADRPATTSHEVEVAAPRVNGKSGTWSTKSGRMTHEGSTRGIDPLDGAVVDARPSTPQHAVWAGKQSGLDGTVQPKHTEPVQGSRVEVFEDGWTGLGGVLGNERDTGHPKVASDEDWHADIRHDLRGGLNTARCGVHTDNSRLPTRGAVVADLDRIEIAVGRGQADEPTGIDDSRTPGGRAGSPGSCRGNAESHHSTRHQGQPGEADKRSVHTHLTSAWPARLTRVEREGFWGQ